MAHDLSTNGGDVIVTFVHADGATDWNSAEWRSAIPARAFNRTKRHKAHLLSIGDFTHHLPVTEYHVEDSEVIILQRGAMPPTWPVIEYWQQRGKKILADIDDGYPQIGPEHPSFNFWHRGITAGPDGQPQALPRPAILDMAEGIRRVNGLVAPNRLILDDWRKQTGVKGAFVPNYPDLRIYKAERTRSTREDGTLWVAWGGSAGHLKSFTDSGILYALARVISARPHVRLIYVGSDPRVMDALPIRDGQKQHFHWRKYSEWPRLLANFDIGLVPAAGDFDARRSWIKPLEYSLMGVPWIASKSPAYDELTDYGVFVDNTPDAWATALVETIDNGADGATMRRAEKWAKSLSIDDHVDEMANIYRSFV